MYYFGTTVPEDKLCYFHDKCPKVRSKTKMTKKYFETKTLFKEVTNLPLEVVHLVGTVGESLRG